jgi:RimJ/RimL family protein N-acetyltransferase
VFTGSDDRFIGYCRLVRAPNNDFDELVYVFHSDVWGQGFATEAATAMLDYVFSISALADIYATIDPLNTASIGVMKKLGFEYHREEMDDLGPVAFYRLSRIQWLSLRV